jgi:hypothetical protein
MKDVANVQLLCNQDEIIDLFKEVPKTKGTYKIRKNIALDKEKRYLDMKLRENNIKKLTHAQLESEIENVKNLPKLKEKLMQLYSESENVEEDSFTNRLIIDIYTEIKRIEDNMIEEQVQMYLKEKENE